MSSKNKFGMVPFEPELASSRRSRAPGPMGAAVRDAADSLQEATEAKVEQRRRNADDAKTYRAAQSEGLVLSRLPVGNIKTDALPRDRMALEQVAQSDEMEELKQSIKERGQKEPIEVYVADDGSYQLKKGWRRLTALTQLHDETGDESFAVVIARVESGRGDQMSRYVDMVEENVIREDLTFAEMAQVAITAAADHSISDNDPLVLVNRLYGALHKVKRSYIRSFVTLLLTLGDDLRWPKAVARNLGVDVARMLSGTADVDALRQNLQKCSSAEAQNSVLSSFILEEKGIVRAVPKAKANQKFEFFVGLTKVTARNGECRIVSKADFTSVDKRQLERAVQAFEEALKAET